MDVLADAHDAAAQMIDTSVVRVHHHGSCIAGNTEQGLLPMVCQRLGLSPGEAHDNRLCSVLPEWIAPTNHVAGRSRLSRCLDQGARQSWANIPPKRNRKDPDLLQPLLLSNT
jgi:hypothetical protein